ncbi:MAG: hypothetical protein FWF41_03310 [Betaproteobacteria bacterium]|nr:hypothetical protein [Betaproteobacteria bacterium]
MWEMLESRLRLLAQLRSLGFGARLLLAFVTGLFGVVMLLIALTGPPEGKAPHFCVFALLCLAIAVACFTKGRVAQFFGSLIASGVLVVALFYLGHELSEGSFWKGSRSQPSIVNALFFCFLFGIPAAVYLIEAKFGLSKKRDERQDAPD